MPALVNITHLTLSTAILCTKTTDEKRIVTSLINSLTLDSTCAKSKIAKFRGREEQVVTKGFVFSETHSIIKVFNSTRCDVMNMYT